MCTGRESVGKIWNCSPQFYHSSPLKYHAYSKAAKKKTLFWNNWLRHIEKHSLQSSAHQISWKKKALCKTFKTMTPPQYQVVTC